MASSIQQARTNLRAMPAWFANATQALIGSRFFVAVLGVFFIAFLAHVTTAPDRLPPLSKVDLVRMIGFAPVPPPPPSLLPSQVRAEAAKAVHAGIPYAQPYIDKAKAAVTTYEAAHPKAIFYANCTGLAVSSVLFLLGIYLLARQESRKR